jgi:uncharacterized protein (DUF169 family)
MALKREDLEILNNFRFEVPPVAVKYLLQPPDKIARLAENMTLCQMLKKAQEGSIFYAGVENHTCGGGPYILGQAELPERFLNGEYGARLQIYEQPRSAARSYADVPRITKGVVNYVAFASLDKLSFESDIMVLLADTGQTEIVLRALSYRTPQVWTSRTTSAVGCGWIFAYPFISGELNYVPTGLGHGMKRRHLFAEGKQFIAIPFDILPSMLQNLRDMPWVLPAYKEDGMEFVKKLLAELGAE